jgi:predicted  nucleic acid-binding Zn-ribbon protein
MSKWYAVIENYECRECGARLARCDTVLKACPSCGWTDKKQNAFDEKVTDRDERKTK